MPDLLLELFSEEIPARMQDDAENHLAEALRRALNEQGYTHGTDGFPLTPQTFATPRRIAVALRHIPSDQPDIHIERKGPKTSAPKAAIDGFLRSTGLSLEQLAVRDGVYFATIHTKGRATKDVLKETIEDILHNFPWPKSMRWANHEVRWVRPLHHVLCMFGKEIVPVQFGALTANNITYGHRFLAPEKIECAAADAQGYTSSLHKAYVIADSKARKAEIRRQIESLAAERGYALIADEGLLDEVTGLVEWPVALIGSIDPEFMELPKEVLISVMRTHQKYFALQASGGTLAPYFITIANRETADNGAAIIAGNERVLRARFSDGRFFWDQDRAKTLEAWAEGLERVTYHAKLGSMAQKVSRIEALALTIASQFPETSDTLETQVQRAARLSKADLMTGMVGEFPELQGIMGRYYAQHQGENAEVADAIADQYVHAKEHLPSAPVSVCLALADRLDTLISLFSVGEKPTGSKDPFALRRAAITVIQLLLKNHLRLPLASLVSKELLAFFTNRLEVILREEGIDAAPIRAVVAKGEDDLVRLVARVRALHHFLQGEAGAALLAAYRRACNILAIEEKKDSTRYTPTMLTPSLLQEPQEKALAKGLNTAQGHMSTLEKGEDFVGMMVELSQLRPLTDDFFTHILVNSEDKALRANRLSLLASIRECMDQVADFSKLEG